MHALVVVVLALPGPTGGPVPREETLRWQVALDRAGFSPGIIDGSFGEKTRTAIAAFQEQAGLRVSGERDEQTAARLKIAAIAPTRRYAVSAADLAQVIPPPKDWVRKSRARRLGYESALEMLAERGHCTAGLLTRLNPRINFAKIAAGQHVILPNVAEIMPRMRAASLEIDIDRKTIRALDERGSLAGLFHCSVAREKQKRPNGQARVISISREPEYLFDPKMWPEVTNVRKKLMIPPGPRNPVGLCWIGLSLEGYGIHGTPEPELIGKTGSHGCFRLTNWDALRLGRMVEVGTAVRFISGSDRRVERLTLHDYSDQR